MLSSNIEINPNKDEREHCKAIITISEVVGGGEEEKKTKKKEKNEW